MLNKLRLSVRIGGGFGFIILIMAALGGTAFFSMQGVRTGVEMLANEYAPEVKIANQLERSALLAMYDMRGYGLSEDTKYLESGRAQLEAVRTALKDAENLAANSEHLVKLGESVSLIEDLETEYESLVGETEIAIAAMAGNRQTLDTSAANYIEISTRFLDGQNQKMESEIDAALSGASEQAADSSKLKERLTKITLASDVIDLGNAVRVGTWKSQAARDMQFLEETMKTFDAIDAKFAELRPITYDEADLKAIDEVDAAAKNYKQAMTDLLANWRKLDELGAARGKTGDAFTAAAQEVAKAGVDATSRISEESDSALANSELVVLAGIVVATIVAILIAIYLTTSITRPINRVIAGLSSGSEQVSSAATQVASASQEMAQGASEQASSLEETSASLEEMASMTKQNADNAGQARTMAQEAREGADRGREATERMSDAIQRIKTSSDETAKIMKTIDEIAFQTNLLALNAAVEAARAGEAGKGFAVVAEEVRNLAQRCAEAARNTASLIEGSQKNAENGVSVSSEVAGILAEIVDRAQKVEQLIQEVSAASTEQSQGIDQINLAVAQMDKVTQGNAANSEEAAAASEELSAQAESVLESVEELKRVVGGRGSNGHTKLPVRQNGSPQKKALASERRSVPSRQLVAVRAPKTSKVKSPDEVIPLDDEDMADF
ncbi:MAG: hypothetical protein AMXMBFR82_32470 [Candidatus Hydrogenedentota bacterium]